MRYISTRGGAALRDFEGVLLAGLAEDGGLFLPEAWPALSTAEWRALRGLPYAELAARLIHPFCGDALSFEDLRAMTGAAYARFGHPAVAPLVQLDHRTFALELFHGPTLAFKDLAMQLLGRLFDHALARRGERVTIVGATSGDTGSAAIEACRGRSALDIVVLFPDGRVSEVQRRQMTTVDAPNVHCVAIDGTFDDCQDLVKGLFNDADFRARHRLSAMNSINWARILPQAVYYVATLRRLGGGARTFAVPTGNFGNVLAGDIARRMGAPVERLVVASNANDILYRWLQSGVMEIDDVVHATTSPSMDIQISSNAERLLFELYDRNGPALAEHMVEFRATGRLDIGPVRLARLRQHYDGGRV
ncbi:MAG: threonine synthase, partial [Acetobacteraceae bacterium]|nr:threonine synthase [Acetobacteraceae bacterium]